MTVDNQKDCKFLFRIDPELLSNYKLLCEKNGYDISKRLRKFIEYEIALDKINLNLIKELDKLL